MDPWTNSLLRARRMAVVALLGFASGLPLALTGQAMQAWLSMDGVDLATIGFLSLVGLPYTFKFLWAPLMDRFDLPWLGRRRGWMVLTQLGMAGVLLWMSWVSPGVQTRLFACVALLLAFLSASQDVVIDAYRTDLLEPSERGLGSSLAVLGYRLGMILSGGVAMIWVDTAQGGAWTWPQVYRLMAGIFVGAAILSMVALPAVRAVPPPRIEGRRDVLGFLAVIAAVALGVVLTERLGTPLVEGLVGALWRRLSLPAPLMERWANLGVLLLGLSVTLPLAGWTARVARFETLLGGLRTYLAQPRARAFLGFIVLYKLGDAFAGSLLTPFLLQGMAYGPAEIGVVNKVLGMWITILGTLLGGACMLRLGLWRALFAFGLLQLASNLGFWALAVGGRGLLPNLYLPAFDWGFVHLTQATTVDGGLLMVIAFENLSGGMGTAALVAFLMGLCTREYSATHYALLSAFAAVGRVWVGPTAGVLAESIGWPTFFVASMVLAAPALGMLVWLRRDIQNLEQGS